MANNNKLISVRQQFAGLPMTDLIGGPLMAAADANAEMAAAQVDFLLSTCIDENDNLVTVNFKLQRPTYYGDDSNKQVDTANATIQIPLITILPLNSLAVTKVNLTFDMEVKSSFTDEDTAARTIGHKSSIKNQWYHPVKIKGSLTTENNYSSSSNYEKSNKAVYHVNVTAGQLPLPEGVKTIITAFSQNIEPISLD